MKKMKFVKKASGIALAAMLAAGLTAGCGGGGGEKKAADAGKEIVVGVNAELTGNVANYGKSMLSGFELAVEEANKAGGVDGKQIKVVTADNKSEPSESGNAATKLVTQNKVVAVIGPATSGCVAAEEPVLTANKIPLIAPCATAPGITLQKDGKTKPFVFRACFIDPYQGDIMAQFAAKDLKVKKAAILHDSSSDYSKGLAEVFTKVFTANGGQITTDEAFLAKDVDFKASLTKIKATNPEAIYVPGYYEEGCWVLTAGILPNWLKLPAKKPATTVSSPMPIRQRTKTLLCRNLLKLIRANSTRFLMFSQCRAIMQA